MRGSQRRQRPQPALDPRRRRGEKCHTAHPPSWVGCQPNDNSGGVIPHPLPSCARCSVTVRDLPVTYYPPITLSSSHPPSPTLTHTMRQAIRSLRQSTPARGVRFNSSSSSSAPNPAQNPQVQKAVDNAQNVLAQTSATVRRVAGPVGDKLCSALGGQSIQLSTKWKY